MARFLEITEDSDTLRSSILVGVGAINYIFNYEGKAVINTMKKFIVTSNNYDEIRKLVAPFQFNETELNGTTINAPKLDTKDKGIKAMINLNKVSSLYGSWQGEIDFEDGTTIDSNFSPVDSIENLKLKQGKYILGHPEE
jgi:hypothetical protein